MLKFCSPFVFCPQIPVLTWVPLHSHYIHCTLVACLFIYVIVDRVSMLENLLRFWAESWSCVLKWPRRSRGSFNAQLRVSPHKTKGDFLAETLQLTGVTLLEHYGLTRGGSSALTRGTGSSRDLYLKARDRGMNKYASLLPDRLNKLGHKCTGRTVHSSRGP